MRLAAIGMVVYLMLNVSNVFVSGDEPIYFCDFCGKILSWYILVQLLNLYKNKNTRLISF